MTIQNQLKIGDVILYTGYGGNLVTDLIKIFAGEPNDPSKYSHAAFYIGFGNIAEMTWKGFRIRDLPDYGDVEIDVFRLKKTLTKKKKDDLLKWIYSCAEKKYDFFQNFLHIFRYFGIKIDINCNIRFNCFEFGARGYEFIGESIVKDSDNATGKEISESEKLRGVKIKWQQ